MRALVTGAAGFIGSHLTKRLCEEGYDVVGIDSFSEYYSSEIKRSNASTITRAGAKLIEGDLNVLDLDRLLMDVDLVFHLAGQPGVRSSWGSEFSTYTEANVEATQRILEASRNNPRLRRLVYASSSSVYGNAPMYPTSECDLPQPASPYGVTKLAGEHLCHLYAESFGVPTVSLRYFTVYGPRQRPDMAFSRFTEAALLNRPISLYGSGEQARDFTYVGDVVEANLLAGTRPLKPGAVFNVAGGSNVTVNEVLEIFEEIAHKRLIVERLEPVAGDVMRTGGDTRQIEAALGWKPTVSLAEGIFRQYEWAAS